MFRHLTIEVGRKSKAKGEREGQLYREKQISESWNRLQQLRDERNAKKRFLWFRNAPPVLEDVCYHISPDAEKQFIWLFFERLRNHTVHVEDKASRATNIWETEFLCSFLQIARSDEARNAPDLSAEVLILPEISEFPELVLRRAKLGFRLHGDFFDRFWTCHFVEEYPGDPPAHNINEFLKSKEHENPSDLFSGGRKQVWQQRKVLELILFYHIITQLNESTGKIIQQIKGRIQKYKDTQERPREIIGKEQNPFSYFDTSRYFKSIREWAHLHDILEVLSAELLGLSDAVKIWENRDERRGTEKPKWTTRTKENTATQSTKLCSKVTMQAEISTASAPKYHRFSKSCSI